MANNYTDHAELRFELNHPLMKRIVELKERNFRDKDAYDYAPLDFDDAMDNYNRCLTSRVSWQARPLPTMQKV